MSIRQGQAVASKQNENNLDNQSDSDAKNTNKNLATVAKKPFKFALVGVFNTILDFGLMNIFKLIGLNLITSNTMSTGIAMISSFFLNKKWTFRNAGKNYLRQVILFFLFTMIGIWVIQNGFIWLIETYSPHFGLSDQLFANVAKLAASIPSLIWNYITYNKIVFRETK